MAGVSLEVAFGDLGCSSATWMIESFIAHDPIGEVFAALLTYAAAYAIRQPTMSERHVKLFKNGRNQAVRIPREFELPGEDAIIRKEGQRLIIEAAPPRSLLAVLATLPTLDENFPPIEDLPAEPVDL